MARGARPAALAAAAALLTLPGAAVAAAGVYTPGPGCTLELTVQERGCSVAQYTRCAADPAGSWRVVYFGKGGELVFVSLNDAEGRWLESSDLDSGITDRLEAPEADPASLSVLLREGRDSYDFRMVPNEGAILRHVGEDRLTGTRRVIDGEPLRETAFTLTTTAPDGSVLITRRGKQYVSDGLGTFFGGPEEDRDWTGAIERIDSSPAAFARKGEPGYGATEPVYDCELLTADAGGGR